METVTFLYKTALAMHYVGFTMLAGTILADFAATFQFWKLALSDWQKAGNYWRMKSKFASLTSVGGLLLVFGGITMIVIIKQAGPIQPQLWFQIKMILVVCLIINLVFTGIRAPNRVIKLIQEEKFRGHDSRIRNAKNWLFSFHIIQLSLLLIIFIISAFRFL